MPETPQNPDRPQTTEAANSDADFVLESVPTEHAVPQDNSKAAIEFTSEIRPVYVPKYPPERRVYLTTASPFVRSFFLLTTVFSPLFWMAGIVFFASRTRNFSSDPELQFGVFALAVSPATLWSAISSVLLLSHKQSTDRRLKISRIGQWMGVSAYFSLSLVMILAMPVTLLMIFFVVPALLVVWIIVGIGYWLGKGISMGRVLEIVTLISLILGLITAGAGPFILGLAAFLAFSIACCTPMVSFVSHLFMIKLILQEADAKGLQFNNELAFSLVSILGGIVISTVLYQALWLLVGV